MQGNFINHYHPASQLDDMPEPIELTPSGESTLAQIRRQNDALAAEEKRLGRRMTTAERNAFLDDFIALETYAANL